MMVGIRRRSVVDPWVRVTMCRHLVLESTWPTSAGMNPTATNRCGGPARRGPPHCGKARREDILMTSALARFDPGRRAALEAVRQPLIPSGGRDAVGNRGRRGGAMA